MFERLMQQLLQQPLAMLFAGLLLLAVAIVILTGEFGFGVLFIGAATTFLGAVSLGVKHDIFKN